MTTTPKRPLLSTFVIAAISLASPLLSSSAHANLVFNGGFEAEPTITYDSFPPFGPVMSGTAVGGGAAALTNGNISALNGILPGWTVGPTGNGLVNAIATNNSAYFGGGPHSGALAAVFPNGLPYDGYISQAIAGLTQGEIYRVSFWLSNQLGDVANNSLGVTFGASTVLAPTALTVPMGWTLYTQDVVADATTMDLKFTGGNTPAGNLLDDVSVIAVPEVSSFGMLTGLGLLAFGTAARFRRRSVATA
jgi:hypothetical protein